MIYSLPPLGSNSALSSSLILNLIKDVRRFGKDILRVRLLLPKNAILSSVISISFKAIKGSSNP